MKARQVRRFWLLAVAVVGLALGVSVLSPANAQAPNATLPVRVLSASRTGGPELNAAPQGQARLAAAPSTLFYLPFISNPLEVAISSMEVTQATQNASNPVPLVANRRAEVRVYVYTLNGLPTGNVRVSLSAVRGGISLSPQLVIGPQTAPVSPSQGNLSSSFNAELPSNWLNGTVTLTAMAYQGTVPAGGTPNNPATATLTFSNVPPLNIMIVPIQYFDNGTGHLYPAPASSAATTLEVSDWITRAYPIGSVNVTYHTPYPFTGDLRTLSDWGVLLSDMGSLKSADSTPGGLVYFALVPTIDQTAGNITWFNGGISGYSYVGYRAGTGLELSTLSGWDVDQTGRNTAHEIGHTLGRLHSPSGGATGVDPSYPYSNGSIGQFGLDIPKQVLWNPATTYDLMGYCPSWTSCTSQWVSDYTYVGLYNNQVAVGAAATVPAPGLLVRANFNSQGQAALQPVYAFDAPLSNLPATSDYTVDLLDANGKVVASHPVAVLQADANRLGAGTADATSQSIISFVPIPAQTVARVRLLHAGQTVSDKALAAPAGLSAAGALSSVRSGGRLTLRWGVPNMPALVRFTPDNGKTWTTLGVDVPGGELQLDAASFPAGVGRFDITLGDAPAGTGLSVPVAP